MVRPLHPEQLDHAVCSLWRRLILCTFSMLLCANAAAVPDDSTSVQQLQKQQQLSACNWITAVGQGSVHPSPVLRLLQGRTQ